MDNRHTALLTFTLFTFKMCHHVLAWPLLISNKHLTDHFQDLQLIYIVVFIQFVH